MTLGGSYSPVKVMSQDTGDVEVKLSLQQREARRHQLAADSFRNLLSSPEFSQMHSTWSWTPSSLLSFETKRELCFLTLSPSRGTAREALDKAMSEEVVLVAEEEARKRMEEEYLLITDDVEPELLSIAELVRYLRLFKDSFEEKYYAAYISLSVGELLEPLILLDVVPSTLRVFHCRGDDSSEAMEEAEEGSRRGLGASKECGVAEAKGGGREEGGGEGEREEGDRSGFDWRPLGRVADRHWHQPLRSFCHDAAELSLQKAAGDEETSDRHLLSKVSLSSTPFPL